MERIILSLLFVVLAQIGDAEAKLRPLARFFELVPVERALLTQGEASDRNLDPESIKVFIWNIKKAGLQHWKQEFKTYGQNKDLFLIQEAYQAPLFVETLREFPEVRWDMGISFLYKLYNNQATGNMIGSNVEPSEVVVKHSPDFEPVVETPKTTTLAKYPIQGHEKELLVVSVHGINLTKFSSFRRHMDQIEEEIKLHDGPVVFAGDFNTRTKTRTDHMFRMIKRLGLTTVAFRNGEHRMKFKLTPHYLDHGFVRGLKVKDAEVLKESNGSDHRPMTMELALSP